MKIAKILDSDFGREMRPKHFCILGIDDMAFATIAGGALDVLGGAATNQLTRDNMRLQSRLNKELQEQAADLQQRNWQTQFDKSNEYNTPSKQVSRLMAAGVNPFVDSSTAAPVAGTNTSPSASGVGVAGVNSAAGPQFNFGGTIRDIVAAARGAKELPYVNELMQGVIKSYFAGAENQSQQARLNQMEADIKAALGKDYAKLIKSKMYAEMLHEWSGAIKDAKLGKLADAQALTEKERAIEVKMNALLNEAKKKLTEQETTALEQKLPELIKVLRTEAELNSKQAKESESRTKLNHISAAIREQTMQGDIERVFVELDKAENERIISSSQVQTARAAAEMAKKTNEHWEQTFWLNFVSSCVDMGLKVFDSYTKMGVYKNLSKIQQQRIDLEVKKMEQKAKQSSVPSDGAISWRDAPEYQ